MVADEAIEECRHGGDLDDRVIVAEQLGEAGDGVEIRLIEGAIVADVDDLQRRDAPFVELPLQDLAPQPGRLLADIAGSRVECQIEAGDRRREDQQDDDGHRRP